MERNVHFRSRDRTEEDDGILNSISTFILNWDLSYKEVTSKSMDTTPRTGFGNIYNFEILQNSSAHDNGAASCTQSQVKRKDLLIMHHVRLFDESN